jgi:hypothetical protein
MADSKKSVASGHAEVYDRELNLRTILGFCGGVVGVTILALLVMWWMSDSFKKMDQAKDAAPSPLAEAQLDPIPPGPRLQPAPPRDMNEMRARDREALTTYGWVDKPTGVARIPVDRAIQILADKAAAERGKDEAEHGEEREEHEELMK